MEKFRREQHPLNRQPHREQGVVSVEGKVIGKGNMLRVAIFLMLLVAVCAFNAMPTRSFNVSKSRSAWKVALGEKI